MKRLTMVMATVFCAACVASGQNAVEKLLARVDGQTEGALVMVKCQYDSDTGPTELAGMGICYNAKKGDFMTLAFGARPSADRIKDLVIVLPGPEQTTLPAAFLGARPEAGVAFIRSKQPHKWQAVSFAAKSNLATGQMVSSVGLMPGEQANTRYLGVAYVSTTLRAPEKIYYVTGGKLTCIGSPVFASEGPAIGLVARTIYMDYQMPTSRGLSTVALKGRQETASFLPVEEFAYVLKRIPEGGKVPRPAWMGVLKALGASKAQAEIRGLTVPAIILDQVISGGPAQKAGLRSGDMLLAVDGEPIQQLASPELTGRNLLRRVMMKVPGDKMALEYRQQGVRKQASITLTAMPLLPEEAPRYGNAEIGLAVREKVPLDAYLDRSQTAKTPGLTVIAVAGRTPSEVSGLKTDDVITAANGKAVRSVKLLRQVIEDALAKKPSQDIVLMVHRSGTEPQTFTISPAAK